MIDEIAIFHFTHCNTLSWDPIAGNFYSLWSSDLGGLSSWFIFNFWWEGVS